MNLIILKGNVYNITTKETKNGGVMTKFTLSTKRQFAKEGEQNIDYHNCTCFGKTAELVQKYVQEKSSLLVQGTQRNDNYEKDGKKSTYSNVLVQSIEFVGGNSGNNQNQKPQQAPSGADGFMNIPTGLEDELPFA